MAFGLKNQLSGTPVFRHTKESIAPLGYALDPLSDITWSAGTSGVADIQSSFNSARTIENNQLGLSLPMLTLPPQSEWDEMSDDERALWLINRERVDRGASPIHSIEGNVNEIAHYYAQYLLDNNALGHYEDGNDPWGRLNTNQAINGCHDFLSVVENLAVFMTSGNSISLPIERSIHMWMYDDGNCCNWGHRHTILWTPYNNNSGFGSTEGFMGIGRASGGPYQEWNHADLIVMNVFDPCSSWDYSSVVDLKNCIIGLIVLTGDSIDAASLLHADTNQNKRVELNDAIMVIRHEGSLAPY